MLRTFLYFLLLISTHVFTQNRQIDSLIQIIKADKEDSVKVEHLQELGNGYYNISDHIKSIEVAEQMLSISKKINYKLGIIKAYNKMGVATSLIGKPVEGLNYYYQALNYFGSETTKIGMATLYGNISNIYISQKKYKMALENANMALKIATALGDRSSIANYLEKIGKIHCIMGDNEKGLSYFEKALPLIDSTDADFDMEMAHWHTGIIEATIQLKKYSKALEHCKLAIHHFEKMQHKGGMIACFIYYAEIFIAQKKATQAEFYLTKAISLSNEIHELAMLSAIYLYLSKVDSLNHDYKSELEHYKQHIDFRDRLFNKESVEKSTQTAMQYEFDKKQLAKEFQFKQEQAALKEQKNYIIIGIVGITIISIFIFIYRNFKQKQRGLVLEKKLKENEMNLLRLQINPHLIFNTLNSINAFITSNLNADAEKYLIKFAKLLRSTLNQSANSFITIQEELNTLSDYIELEQLRLNHSFTYIINTDKNVNTSNKMPPLILQPFVENAILHGLKHKPNGNGLLTVKVQENENLLTVTITDNGVGRKEAERIKAQKTYKHVSKAIAITTQRVELLKNQTKLAGITITDLVSDVDVALGTEVTVRLPINI